MGTFAPQSPQRYVVGLLVGSLLKVLPPGTPIAVALPGTYASWLDMVNAMRCDGMLMRKSEKEDDREYFVVYNVSKKNDSQSING